MTHTNEFALSDDLAAQLDASAVTMQRSRESIVQEALAAWLEREDRHHRLTLEGLDDIDAGRLIAHADVADWAGSLDSLDPRPLPEP